jgi:hypothetical protein
MSIPTNTSPVPTPPPNPKFDQVVEGNVNIKQLSKKKYKITFSKIGKFLLYQVWSDSSKKLNENRKVFYQKAKLWVQLFNLTNDSLKASDKPLFTPTSVMEIGNNKYVFVIHKAKLNGKGHVVFKVSTKEIKLSDKKMLKLPCGHHDGVRFDIDDNLYNKQYSCNSRNLLLQSYGINCTQYNCSSNLGGDAPIYCSDAIQRGCGNQYPWNSDTLLPFPATYINCQ